MIILTINVFLIVKTRDQISPFSIKKKQKQLNAFLILYILAQKIFLTGITVFYKVSDRVTEKKPLKFCFEKTYSDHFSVSYVETLSP